MKNYSALLKARRARCKSQAFVEFTICLPFLLLLVCGLADYGFMLFRLQILAMAAREGANTATRILPKDASIAGLSASYNAGRTSGVDLTGPDGTVIITHVWYDSASLKQNTRDVLLIARDYTSKSPPPVATDVDAKEALGREGSLYGDDDSKTYNKSRILKTSGYSATDTKTDWTSPYRTLPFDGNNLVDGDPRGLYAVEVFYTNRFITPLGNMVKFFGGQTLVPQNLYDSAYFSSITGAPQSVVDIPAYTKQRPTPTPTSTPTPNPPPNGGVPPPTVVTKVVRQQGGS